MAWLRMLDVPTRRRVLTGLGALAAAPLAAILPSGCGPGPRTGSSTGPGTGAATTVRYGSDPSQFGELSLPMAASAGSAGSVGLPVVVVVHGGYWTTGYGLELGRPLAVDLSGAGVATWNLEYRRVGPGAGGGGGWPATGIDVAAAVDALAGSVQQAAAAHGVRLDLDRVVVLGHSAGGQLAGWLAARPGLAAGLPGAGPRVRVTGAVSQAGVLDLVAASRLGLGGGAVDAFLGGSPAGMPTAYAQASPAALVPIGVPSGVEMVCVHGTDDIVVPPSQSQDFVAADQRAGGRARLRMVPGDHFAMITTGTPAWRVCRAETLRLLGR